MGPGAEAISVQQEMQKRKQLLKQQMHEHGKLQSAYPMQSDHDVTVYKKTRAAAPNEPTLVPVAILLAAPDQPHESLLSQEVHHESTFDGNPQSWSQYSQMQQQQHSAFRSSMKGQPSHQRTSSHTNLKEADCQIVEYSGGQPDGKNMTSAKTKDRLVRGSKAQKEKHINLTVTNSLPANQSAVAKHRSGTGRKLKRAGTVAAEGQQAVSRGQKVAGQQATKGQGKGQSTTNQAPIKKQAKENSVHGQQPSIEQTTYQTIKSIAQQKNAKPPMRIQHQPQIQYNTQQSSGQKQRPKSSNPATGQNVMKRRNILHIRDESFQLNLQNQQMMAQVQTSQQSCQSQNSCQTKRVEVNDFEATGYGCFTEPSTVLGAPQYQSRSRTNLITQNVPLCITGSVTQQQINYLDQPQIINNQSYHTNKGSRISKEELQRQSQSFFVKRNSRNSFNRGKESHEEQRFFEADPSHRAQATKAPGNTAQIERVVPAQSLTAKPKNQSAKIEMALVSAEYNCMKNGQQPPNFERNYIQQRPQSSSHQMSGHKQAASMSMQQSVIPPCTKSFVISDAESEQSAAVMERTYLVRNNSSVCEVASASEKFSYPLTHPQMVKSTNSFDRDGEPPAQKIIASKRSILSNASPGSKGAKARKSGTQMMQPTTTTHDMQMLPSTPKAYKRTKRVHFARRMSHMDRPLILINFQGVVGDFIKLPAFRYNPNAGKLKPQHRLVDQTREEKAAEQELNSLWRGMNLRLGALEGLKYLSRQFQLVIFSRETIEESWFEQKGGQVAGSGEQTKVIMSLLAQNPEIKLDGLYTSGLPHKSQSICDDYSQIFLDFGLNSEKKVCEKVLFVISLANDFVSNQQTTSRKPNNDLDEKGFFMFDLSCQPAIPLVKGLPISLDVKNDPVGSQQGLQPNGRGPNGQNQARREMPVTLLVPNVRTQTLKTCLNFSQIVKSILLMAHLGQKKNTRQLLKDITKEQDHKLASNSAAAFKSANEEAEEGLTIKERLITLSKRQMKIVQIPTAESSPSKIRKFQQTMTLEKAREEKSDRIRKEKAQMTLTRNMGKSPTGSVNSHLSGGQNSSLSTQSNLRNNRTNPGYGRSASTQSEKFRPGPCHNSELIENTLQLDQPHSKAREASPGLGSFFQTESQGNLNTAAEPPIKQQNEITVDLTDQFYQNLSWTSGADFLLKKDASEQRNFLGFRAAYSNVAWRYYSKQVCENLQIKAIYEQKMAKIEDLVKKTLSNETIVDNREKNIDAVFQILRCGNLNGNPMGMTMGRNYRFFANIHVSMRSKFAKELRAWKELNEAASNLNGEIGPQMQAASGSAQAKDGELQTTLDKQSPSKAKEKKKVQRGNEKPKIKDILDRHDVYNRILTIGMDQPQLYFNTTAQKGKVLEKFNPQAATNHQNFSSNAVTQPDKVHVKQQEKGDRANSRKSHHNADAQQPPQPQLQPIPVNIDRPFESAHPRKLSQRQQQTNLQHGQTQYMRDLSGKRKNYNLQFSLPVPDPQSLTALTTAANTTQSKHS